MAQEPCITHPRESKFSILRPHMAKMFGGDPCAAIVIDYFEFHTNGELARFDREKIKGRPWITAPLEHIYQHTAELYCTKSIHERIAALVQLGFLKEDEFYGLPGGPGRYLLNADFVNGCIAKNSRFDMQEVIKKLFRENPGKTFGVESYDSEKVNPGK